MASQRQHPHFDSERQYLERGVQTSPPRSSTPTRAATTPKSTFTHLTSDGYPSSCISTPNSSRSPYSTYLGSAYSHSCRADSDVSSPAITQPWSRKSVARSQKLGRNRPSELRVAARRVISHPENAIRTDSPLPGFEDATMRVVSLPERPKPVPVLESPSPIRFHPGNSMKLYVPGDADYFRNREHTSTSSDVPQTPSPPSSPESSVLIIGSDVHLPRRFIRNYPDRPRFDPSDNGGIACLGLIQFALT
jgi:hypothetical protein